MQDWPLNAADSDVEEPSDIVKIELEGMHEDNSTDTLSIPAKASWENAESSWHFVQASQRNVRTAINFLSSSCQHSVSMPRMRKIQE